MAMKSPSARDDRKDLERTASDVESSKASPGTDASRRTTDDRAAGPHGGLAPNGQGMTSREQPHKKIATGRREGETSGEGSWSGRDSERGPNDTSAGQTLGTANEVRSNAVDERNRKNEQ